MMAQSKDTTKKKEEDLVKGNEETLQLQRFEFKNKNTKGLF